MTEKIKLIKVDYELNKNPWKANILCTDSNDAAKTLLSQIKKASIKTVSNEGDVHDISKKALDIILKSKKIKENDEQIPIKYVCPWCDKSYDDPKYLKIHLNKGHNIKEQK